MKILVRLYNMEDPAADGSIIPRLQTSNYLSSDEYRRMTEEHLALCGITHKDRVLDSSLKNVVGPDDQVLIHGNHIGYIDQIFLRDSNDKYCYAYIQVFDPDQFAGEVRDRISNFIGLMKAGTKLPCSVVIQAMWSPSNRAERIIRIKGMDFTLNPSFKGSGTVKVMSHKGEPREGGTSMFSEDEDGLANETRAFTTEMTVISQENGGPVSVEQSVAPSAGNVKGTIVRTTDTNVSGDPFGGKKTFTREEIISKYGRGSKVADATVGMNSVPVKFISSIIDGTLDQKLGPAFDLIAPEISDPSDAKKEELYGLMRRHYDDVIDIIKDAPDSDDTKVRLMQYLSGLPSKTRIFSTVKAIEDRMRYSVLPPAMLFRRTLDNYRTYYRAKNSSFDDEDRAHLRDLMITDIRMMLNSCRKAVSGGSSLSAMLQLSRFGSEMHDAGTELGKVMRRANITNTVMGFVPSGIKKSWQQAFTNFLNEVFAYVFDDENYAVNLKTFDLL